MFGKRENNLAARMQRGDPAAFAELVDAFGPGLHRLSRRYARSEADAEDLTQEVFIAVSQGIAGFRRDAKLTTWIYRIALNLCLKHCGRRDQTPPVALDDLMLAADGARGPERMTMNADLRREIDDALDSLTDGHREVVILHELNGLTYAECATVLGVPLGTVKSRLFNAFARLRGRLKEYVEDTESAPGERSVTDNAHGFGGCPAAFVGGKAR